MAQAQLIYPEGASCERNIAAALVRFQAGDHLEGAGSIVYAADAKRGTVVRALYVGVGATAVTILDGATTVFHMLLGAQQTIEFDPPKVGSPNTALTVTIAGGGTLDVHAWREN